MSDKQTKQQNSSNGEGRSYQQVVVPCPRFEFLWEKIGGTWLECECIYSLVIPLGKLDIRHTDVDGNPTELKLEISRTVVHQPRTYKSKARRNDKQTA